MAEYCWVSVSKKRTPRLKWDWPINFWATSHLNVFRENKSSKANQKLSKSRANEAINHPKTNQLKILKAKHKKHPKPINQPNIPTEKKKEKRIPHPKTLRKPGGAPRLWLSDLLSTLRANWRGGDRGARGKGEASRFFAQTVGVSFWFVSLKEPCFSWGLSSFSFFPSLLTWLFRGSFLRKKKRVEWVRQGGSFPSCPVCLV